jgi:hypothetical protein
VEAVSVAAVEKAGVAQGRVLEGLEEGYLGYQSDRAWVRENGGAGRLGGLGDNRVQTFAGSSSQSMGSEVVGDADPFIPAPLKVNMLEIGAAVAVMFGRLGSMLVLMVLNGLAMFVPLPLKLLPSPMAFPLPMVLLVEASSISML